MRFPQRRLLFVTDRELTPPLHGNRVRALEFIHSLIEHGFIVDLLTLREFYSSNNVAGLNRVWGVNERAFVAGQDAESHDVPAFRAEVCKLCLSEGYDGVIIQHQFLHRAIDNVPQGIETLLLAHDVFSRREHFDSGWVRCTPEGEATIVRKFKAVVVHSADCHDFARMSERGTVIPLPISLPSDRIRRLPVSETPSLLFVGYDHPGNVGILDFVEQCFKPLHLKFPCLTLRIVGTVVRRFHACPKGVIFHDFLPALKPAYRHARIVVLPITQGTGMSIKLIEALAYGRAVVSTRVGVRGLPPLVESFIGVTDSVDAMAGPLEQLLQDSSKTISMANKAHEYVTLHHTRQAALKAFVQWWQVTKKERDF